MNRRTLLAMLGILVLLWLSVSIKSLILGNATPVSLATAPPLSGVISQSLGIDNNGTLSVDGQDYTLSTQYFDNNTWAVSHVKPLNNSFDPTVAVLEKRGGMYQVVFGPASALPSNEVQGLPTDVANYLHTQIGIYTESIN